MSRVAQQRHDKDPFARAEVRRLSAFFAIVGLLHVLGWGTLALFVAPKYPSVLGIGVGFTAYLLGLRHAFDADHISAIDNTTRKLIAEGKQPLGVGFFFSLGHSTTVLGLALAIATAQQVAGQLIGDNSTLRDLGGILGTGSSAIFLYLIAALNVVILVDVLRVLRQMRRGEYSEEKLEAQLIARGLMGRFFGRISRTVSSSWQMFPVGFLFGLGFDTASQVTLLALAAGAESDGLPFYAILCLPIIFAAGMSVMDTADGAFMNKAYEWAFSGPVRKIYYNVTITGLSISVALLVGTAELLGILRERFHLSSPFWRFIASLDFGVVGYMIVALFVITWAVSYAVWKLFRIEERWQLPKAPSADGVD
ncbi:MAG: HoxN/HupN/NixA family nickel/cobalt transporter [Bacteroidetes bacterium]|nr:HoxN/HupN/NixA family nickel/cobalt transporter [Bacteroidota bacterium]